MSATYNTNTTAPFGAISIFRVASAFEHGFRAVSAWRRARRTRLALASLSDAQLADIGVSRGQITSLSGKLATR